MFKAIIKDNIKQIIDSTENLDEGIRVHQIKELLDLRLKENLENYLECKTLRQKNLLMSLPSRVTEYLIDYDQS